MPAELVSVEKPLTAKEKELVQEMTKASTIEVVVPINIDPKDWKFAADVTCRVIRRAQMQEEQLLPVLGRLLIVAQENPEIYRGNGYDGFEVFIQAEVRDKWGFSRSTCYEAMKMARFAEAAGISVEDYKEIGRANSRELVAAVQVENAGNKDAKKLIELAKTMPVADFKEHLIKNGYVEKGETTGAFIRIPCSQAIAKRWKNFSENPDVQAHVGSGNPGKILDALMAECRTEWITRAGERQKAS